MTILNANCTLDPTALERLTEDGSPSVVMEILKLFSETTVQRIESLISASARADMENLWRVAHSMKSSCAYVGALRLQALCVQAEERSRAQPPQSATEIIREMELEFAKVQKELKKLSREIPHSNAISTRASRSR
jgi:HPt (histidine-containing phosphotransfer) domain-containing protein